MHLYCIGFPSLLIQMCKVELHLYCSYIYIVGCLHARAGSINSPIRLKGEHTAHVWTWFKGFCQTLLRCHGRHPFASGTGEYKTSKVSRGKATYNISVTAPNIRWLKLLFSVGCGLSPFREIGPHSLSWWPLSLEKWGGMQRFTMYSSRGEILQRNTCYGVKWQRLDFPLFY